MTPTGGYNPCLAPVRRSSVRRSERTRVVEVLATGTNGGAQEHLYNLISRMDRDRYDVSVVSLSPGSAVRKLERLGIPVTVIDEPDDAIATGILAAHLVDVRAEVIHNHMYRAEIVGTKAAIALGEAGHRRPWVISTVHSSRVRSCDDQEELIRLTSSIDHLIAVSHSIDRKIVAEGRTAAPRSIIYNGVDLERYDHQEPCCTLRDEYGMEPTSPIVGVVGRLELEKGHPTLLEAWPLVLEACPSAYLLIVGEGSRLDALHDIAREQGIDAARRVHRPPRRHPGGDRGLRRRRAALLSRGAGPDDPRGDGALAPGRRVQRRRDPGDDRGRRHGAARPAARPAGARRGDRAAAGATTSWRTCSAAPATTSSTTASAWS